MSENKKEAIQIDTNSPHFSIGLRDGREGHGPSYIVPEYLAGYEKGRAEYKQAQRHGWVVPDGWDAEAWLYANK